MPNFRRILSVDSKIDMHDLSDLSLLKMLNFWVNRKYSKYSLVPVLFTYKVLSS